MSYRVARVDVKRFGPICTATAILADDGYDDDGEPTMFRGMVLEAGEYLGLTRKAAWLRALRGNGGGPLQPELLERDYAPI